MEQSQRERLSRFIHEKAFGECWHETRELSTEERKPITTIFGRITGYELPASSQICVKCGEPISAGIRNGSLHVFNLPDYTSDLNRTALAEAKVIEMKGAEIYGEALIAQSKANDRTIPDTTEEAAVRIAHLSAEQRCRAIEAAWTSSVKEAEGV